MLSYQHIYHAGNLADVHKHALLAEMLAYLTAKDKPLTYLETHAGRGLYQLDAPEAVKTGEARAGIGRVRGAGGLPEDHPLTAALREVVAGHGPNAYPGSPLVALNTLRPMDTVHLCELHPQEFAALRVATARYPVSLHHQSGWDAVMSIAPPTPRRGMVLIDPSYEIAKDYATIPDWIGKLHRKWNVGVIALWYPILTSGAHAPMLARLEAAGLPKTVRSEVRFAPAREGHRMIGSGLFVVNAPFGTEQAAQRVVAMIPRD